MRVAWGSCSLFCAVAAGGVCQPTWALAHRPPVATVAQATGPQANAAPGHSIAGATTEGPLELGHPVKGLLQGEESRSYGIQVAADRYVEARVEQDRVEVLATVFGPDGTELAKTPQVGNRHDSKRLTFVAPLSGMYRLEVRAGARNTGTIDYAVVLVALRTPTGDDRVLEDARLLSITFRDLIDHGKYDDALAPATRALELRTAVLGPDHLLVADALHALAVFYDNKGDYAKAEPVNLRALAIREQTLGPDHPDVARSLYNLAWIYLVRQEFARAEEAYQRVLAIQERAFGTDHREVTTTLNDLSILYEKRGDYDRAVEIDERVLEIRERLFGPTDKGVARTLSNLAVDYQKKGDYARAEPLLLRALSIWEQTVGPEHPDTASSASNLGVLYNEKGDYASAETFHKRALAIDEKVFGPNDEKVGIDLNNLAWLYQHQGDYAKAGPLFRRALAVREQARGPNHSDVAEALNNLANFYLVSETGTQAETERLLRRALAIVENTHGSEYHTVGNILGNLGRLYDERGDYNTAAVHYERALAVEQQSLGPNHPDVAGLLARLAKLYRAKGEPKQALAFWSRYSEVVEHNLEHNLPIGSERQKLTYLKLFADDTNSILSFQAQSASEEPEALRLAFSTLLRRKGRALDALVGNVGLLRSRASSDDQLLFEKLADLRSQLAAMTLRGPGSDDPAAHSVQLGRIQERVEALEAQIAVSSAAFRAESRAITIETVQSALPSGSALVEFARYTPTKDDGTALGPPRYAAYVLFGHGDPQRIDLAEEAIIDQLVDAWREALRDPRRTDVGRLARAADTRIMQPVRARLGTTEQLLVSPDGLLNVMPFEALVDERGKYLIERYAISYLTSGRDLLRLQVTRPSRSNAVVVADPDFGDPAVIPVNPGSSASAEPSQSPTGSGARIDYSQMFFGPLPGVTGEVQALRTLLPTATFLTKRQATKAAIMRVRAPRILHVATHGFFLADEPRRIDATLARRADRRQKNVTQRDTTRLAKVNGHIDNPLLRSGLALAGANLGGTRANAGANGVLTALEAADLDLWGTGLVVLSACDTGVGTITDGEGIYGLRRALVLAGSESQMMTLWPVSDRRTRDFIVGYYTSLLGGSGRAAALRHVQLQMLRARAHAHPYYWASFILSGQWASLSDAQ